MTMLLNSTVSPMLRANVIDRETLARTVPSIFAARPYVAMSERYKFLPTIEVIDLLADRGFLPVKAHQSMSRIEGKGDFTRHMVRFRHKDKLIVPKTVGTLIEELILTNSHDGTSAVAFSAGVFRLACLNGLIVAHGEGSGFKVRHTGKDDWQAQVIDASFAVADQSATGVETLRSWGQIPLTQPQQNAFAIAALEVRPIPHAEPRHLLATRRLEDRSTDLATTFNVVQENATRGGVRTENPDSRRRATTRDIKSVGEDLRINRALWRLTEEMAKLV